MCKYTEINEVHNKASCNHFNINRNFKVVSVVPEIINFNTENSKEIAVSEHFFIFVFLW